MNTLFCIKHQKVVFVDNHLPVLAHMQTIQLNRANDVGDRYDLEECDFPEGWASCPPPEFDMDAYMEEVGQPPEIVDEMFVEEVYTV